MELYRLDRCGSMLLEGQFEYPNGVALSRDEKTLYLALTLTQQIVAINVMPNGSLHNPRLYATASYPDGMAIDVTGHIYIASSEGIKVVIKDGTHLGIIKVEPHPSNCAFAGTDGKAPIITARTAVY